MTNRFWRWWCLLLLAGSLFLYTPAALAQEAIDPWSDAAPATDAASATVSPGDTIYDWVWTAWSADQYALADDGEAIWVGGYDAVLRFEKATEEQTRYNQMDGAPPGRVLAVAVDAGGNRWFGGDGGLVRLDAGDAWTHFTSENSGLADDLVDGIAVGGDGSLWLSHGLPDGSVSQRLPNGDWRLHPNRFVPMAADWENVLATQNLNPLWTVAVDEVWVGFWVYDGTNWTDRSPFSDQQRTLATGVMPEDTGEVPEAMAADSQGNVWALNEDVIRSWDGTRWTEYRIYFPFGGRIDTLTVDVNDVVWIGYTEREGPYGNEYAGVAPLDDLRNPQDSAPQSNKPDYALYVPGPVVGLLPAADGLWAIGSGWLHQAGVKTLRMESQAFVTSDHSLADDVGQVWVHSGQFHPYSDGRLQVLDDRMTATATDDLWEFQPPDDPLEVMTAMESGVAGDIWMGSGWFWRVWEFDPIWRIHDGQWLRYYLPVEGGRRVVDIFVQDDRRVWFVTDYPYSDDSRRLRLFDDGGTPEDTGDDTWHTYSLPGSGTSGVVAVDSLDRLWYGDTWGLYLRSGSSWKRVYDERQVCDLVPAADGTLFVLVRNQDMNCTPPHPSVYVIGADGQGQYIYIVSLVERHIDLVRSASRRNALWAVGPDGTVWFWHLKPPLVIQNSQGIRRAVPGTSAGVLDVDPAGRVWSVVDHRLHRLALRPDFDLEGVSSRWFIQPGGSSFHRLQVTSIGGFDEPVLLTVEDLPVGMTVNFEPNPVQAGSQSTMTLQVDPVLPLGDYDLRVAGSSGSLDHWQPLQLHVMSDVMQRYLPVALRR